MKYYKNVNGVHTKMTQEEIEQMQKQNALYNLQNKYTPKSSSEVMDMFVRQNIQTLDVTDNEALCMKNYYPTFEDIVGKSVDKGFKFTYQNDLWRVVQTHTVQDIYPPSVDTAALYERIDEQYEGTLEEPIPYKSPMELELGKYYTDGIEIYECYNGTGAPVVQALNELEAFVRVV